MNPLCKIFSILETVVARQSRGATYSEIVVSCNLPKSSVHRILKDLTELGYLTFDPEKKRYHGSLKLAGLGAEVMAHFHMRDHVRSFLLQLHQETGHTANFAIRNGTVGVFVDKIQSKDFGIKLFSEIGKTFPLYCTGLGKVLLAYAPQEVFETLLSRPLEKITDKTVTDPRCLVEEIESIRSRGFAFDNEEITRGIMCVAAPVFGFGKELAGAISITFPATIHNERTLDPEVTAICNYASLISASLNTIQIENQDT
ncbi:MAG: IclR family transcriptional regulator [Desulforhopalus sp.]